MILSCQNFCTNGILCSNLKCLKCAAFCSAKQSNLHPVYITSLLHITLKFAVTFFAILQVPSMPDKAIVTDINSTELAVSWSESKYTGKSRQIGYTVEYLEANNKYWEEWQDIVQNTLSTTLVGLEHYQRYKVRVRAVCEVGKGPAGTPSDMCMTRPKLSMYNLYM